MAAPYAPGLTHSYHPERVPAPGCVRCVAQPLLRGLMSQVVGAASSCSASLIENVSLCSAGRDHHWSPPDAQT